MGMVLPGDSSINPRTYSGDFFDKDFGSGHPLDHFRQWYQDALENDVVEPDAFTLSTSLNNKVNARMVALRGITDSGLLIYTNYNSTKAHEIENNNEVALTFYWREIYRQIRIRGNAYKSSEEQSNLYFESRPRQSKVGAWTSLQSNILSSRQELLDSYNHFDKTLGENIARPPFWGGYEVIPYEYEFFHGQKNRLHDRYLFKKDKLGNFISQQLWP